MEERVKYLETKVYELERQLQMLLQMLLNEKAAIKEAERLAAAKNAEMWAYYQAEEYKARQEARESEDCRNDN